MTNKFNVIETHRNVHVRHVGSTFKQSKSRRNVSRATCLLGECARNCWV